MNDHHTCDKSKKSKNIDPEIYTLMSSADDNSQASETTMRNFSFQAEEAVDHSKAESRSKKTYRKYTSSDCEKFFQNYMKETGSYKEAASKLFINYRTAISWIKKFDKDTFELPEVGYKGRRTKGQLDDVCKDVIHETLNREPGASLTHVLGQLNVAMSNTNINQKAVKRFLRKEYGFSLTLVEREKSKENFPAAKEETHQLFSRIVENQIKYEQNCVFISHSQFTCHARKNGVIYERYLKIVAAVFSNGSTHIFIEPMVKRGGSKTIPKESHKTFMTDLLSRLKPEAPGKVFLLIDSDFAKCFPNFHLHFNCENCELIEFPQSLTRLNPVERLWTLLENSVATDEPTAHETTHSRVKAAANSINPSTFIQIYRRLFAELQILLANQGIHGHETTSHLESMDQQDQQDQEDEMMDMYF